MTTVTADSVVPHAPEGDGFSVSYTEGADIAGALLHVRRLRWLDVDLAERLEATGRVLSMRLPRELDGRVQVMFPCEGDGLAFPSREEAKAFALERGYLQPYLPSRRMRAWRQNHDRLTGLERVRRVVVEGCPCAT